MQAADFKTRQYQFAAWLRDPDNQAAPKGIEARRLAIYRNLMYSNIEGFIRKGFPVLHSLIPEARWHAMVRQFFAGHSSQTPYFTEISGEFVAWLNQSFQPDHDDPPFLRALAHYEWMEVVVGLCEEHIPADASLAHGSLLEGAPLLSPLATLNSYHWPVHKIGPAFQPDQPLQTPVWLLVWRDRQGEVGFMEVNQLTAHLLQQIDCNPRLSGRELLERMGTQMQTPDLNAFVVFGAEILEKLRDRDIILGTHVEH